MRKGDKIRISENKKKYYLNNYKVGLIGEVTFANDTYFYVKFKDGNSYIFYLDNIHNDFVKYEKIDRNKNLKYLLENI